MATGLLALVLLGQGLPALAQTTVEYIHTDALGSPVAVTNQAGQVIERNDYEPYGAMIGKPDYQGIGYTGHVQDAATGLTYMQQRYYDSQVGLFLSVDPVTAYSNPVGQFHRYRYANNSPYKFTDPDGRLAFDGNSDRREKIRELEQRGIFPLQENGSGKAKERSPEENDYYAERAKMGERAEETFKEVGVFTAKEAGQMFAFARVGKWLGGIGRFFGLAKKEVSFGRNANQLSHTFRHVERAGLSRGSVQQAVQADLRQSASQIVAGRPFNQTIDVGGTRITYTAFKLEDGTINVGRIVIRE